MTTALLDQYRIQYLEYMTPIDNLPSIFQHGILSHNRAHRFNLVREDISDPNVQNIRANKLVNGNQGPLHDYVNLYFNSRNPMMFRRKNVQDNIAILCVDRNYIGRRGVWYSDGNAASGATRFYYSRRRLYELNWNCIWADYWNDYEDGTRIRCAEVLIPGQVPSQDIQQVVVRTEHGLERARRIIPDNVPIIAHAGWFF